jgi:hypothetical protein
MLLTVRYILWYAVIGIVGQEVVWLPVRGTYEGGNVEEGGSFTDQAKLQTQVGLKFLREILIRWHRSQLFPLRAF